MNTESATKIIAYIYEGGSQNPAQKIKLSEKEAQWLNISDEEIEDYTSGKARNVPDQIQLEARVKAIYAQARAWNWGEVEKHILRCYKLLEAEAPEINHGLAFHRGEHPIQQVISAEAV